MMEKEERLVKRVLSAKGVGGVHVLTALYFRQVGRRSTESS
jgi:hypothetical protein